MKCEKCGAEVGTGHIACMKCGALLPLTNNDNYGLNWNSNITFDSNYNKPEPVVEETVEVSEPVITVEPEVELEAEKEVEVVVENIIETTEVSNQEDTKNEVEIADEVEEVSEPEVQEKSTGINWGPVENEKTEENPEPEVKEEPVKINWEPVEPAKKKEESEKKSSETDSSKEETVQSKRVREFAERVERDAKFITAPTAGKTISGCLDKIKTAYKARTEKDNNWDLIWASIVDILRILLGLFVFKVFVPVVKALAIFFDSDTYRKIKKKYKEIIDDDKKFAKALIIFVVGLIVIILLISKIAIWLNKEGEEVNKNNTEPHTSDYMSKSLVESELDEYGKIYSYNGLIFNENGDANYSQYSEYYDPVLISGDNTYGITSDYYTLYYVMPSTDMVKLEYEVKGTYGYSGKDLYYIRNDGELIKYSIEDDEYTSLARNVESYTFFADDGDEKADENLLCKVKNGDKKCIKIITPDGEATKVVDGDYEPVAASSDGEYIYLKWQNDYYLYHEDELKELDFGSDPFEDEFDMTSNGQLCISLRDSILYVYNAVSDEYYKTSVWFEDDYDWRVTEDEINLVYTNGEKLVEKDYSVDGPEETVLSDSCHRFLCQDVYLWYADDTGVVYRSNYNDRNRKITTINDINNWDVVGKNLYHIDNSGLHRVNSDGEDEILDKSAETMEYTEGDEFIVYTDKYEDTHILLGKNNWIIDLDELE